MEVSEADEQAARDWFRATSAITYYHPSAIGALAALLCEYRRAMWREEERFWNAVSEATNKDGEDFIWATRLAARARSRQALPPKGNPR